MELIDGELNFTVDMFIYRIVYSHKIWVLTALLLFTKLIPVFTLVLEQINKEFNFNADLFIYHIVYSHEIWVLTTSLLFTQLFKH